jgi:hypothetical protein
MNEAPIQPYFVIYPHPPEQVPIYCQVPLGGFSSWIPMMETKKRKRDESEAETSSLAESESEHSLPEEQQKEKTNNTKQAEQPTNNKPTEKRSKGETKQRPPRKMNIVEQPFYQCPYCPKTFDTQFKVWGHQHTHTKGSKKAERLRVKGNASFDAIIVLFTLVLEQLKRPPKRQKKPLKNYEKISFPPNWMLTYKLLISILTFVFHADLNYHVLV